MPMPIMIEYITYEGPLTPEVLSDLATIYAAAFGEEPPEDLEDRINQNTDIANGRLASPSSGDVPYGKASLSGSVPCREFLSCAP